ncbi:uncharacterized protein LOC121430454 [Lytechinus variegatus]|uniref:uncharacterized protein LOC121430454 n=1 Tax=Lytechinus variegatus TaxID=7654 RepID=UPI001BB23120|nr:uncharacterized protein LOC121430454 [Lytechinus variegatus]
MSWSKDDESVDHTTPRIRVDAGGNLHIAELQESDAGTYTCQTTYWETTVTTTQVNLHVGGTKPGESGGIFGVPVPWVISVGAAFLLLIIFGGFTIATKPRSGDKSPEYSKIPDEEQAIDEEEGEEEEEEAED